LPAFFGQKEPTCAALSFELQEKNLSMEHFLLEVFRIVAEYILGPVAIAWLTAKLNNKPKA